MHPFLTSYGYVKWSATAPDIKVILLTRDTKQWVRSWLQMAPRVLRIYESRPFTFSRTVQDVWKYCEEHMRNIPTQGRPELYEDASTLMAGYEAWMDFVRKTVPPERLLVFDVRQGWGPLCEFLELPVPSTPFPHVNEKAVVDITLMGLTLITYIWPLILASPMLLLYCCCRCCCRKNAGDSSKKRQ